MDEHSPNDSFDRSSDGFEVFRTQILGEAQQEAVFAGWNAQMVKKASEKAEVAPATLKAAFPAGVADVLQFWSEAADSQMTAAMGGKGFGAMKIREKVAFAVQQRLDILAPHKEAARRAAAWLALPMNAHIGTRLVWATADSIWRGLGDKSTDFNYYTKRATLGAVWTSTFARWLADDSECHEETTAFLAARIENVMQIEKAKAKVRDLDLDPGKLISAFAKLRYPS